MNTITSFFKKFASGTHGVPETIVANPSEVLRINRDDITGTLEFRDLNQPDDNPSKVLRVSWIKRDETKGVMKTVWITDEIALY